MTNLIPTKHRYPTLVGKDHQVYSKAGPEGISQQFIDRGMQKEIGLHRRTLQPSMGQNGYSFEWTLTFYIHPGMRREIDVKAKLLPEMIDYIHALAVGVAPIAHLERRVNDWCQFHTFGFAGAFETGKEVLAFLKRRHFSWEMVEKNIAEYGIEALTKDREV